MAMRSTLATRRVDLAATLARNRLGVAAVLIFVMSAAAPLTVVAGVITTGYAVTGITGIPVAFVAVGLVLAVFSVGYVAMARQVENAGAFYAYVARGLGRPVGVGAAWVALVAYNALQVGLYGAIGAAAQPLLEQWFGLRVAWWMIGFAAWLMVAVLGLLRVDVNGKVLAALLLAEVAMIVAVDLVAVGNPAGGTVSFGTLDPGNLIGPGAGAILALALLGFVGFESAVVYAEESRDPNRTVRLATYLSVAVIAALYAGSAWAMSVATGPEQIVARSAEEGPDLVFNLAGTHLGQVAADIGHALFVTSLLAAMISFHNTTARYAFALGREAVLPRWFGLTWRRTNAPVVGSLLQSLIGFAVIAVYGIAGWNPLVRLFYWGGTAGGYGVLLLVATTAVAVLVHGIGHRRGDGAWRRVVAPALAAVALLAMAALASWELPNLLGVTAQSPVRWAVHTGYLLAAALGIGWGLVLRATRPDVYQRIGYGAKAATVGATPGLPEPRRGWTQEPTERHEVIR